MSPEWREKWRGFRGERRAWWSLLWLLGLLVASLPAELLCNSRPLLIVQDGRWSWPALVRYTDRDFGGDREVEPDYASLAFLKLLGLDPGAAGGGTAGGDASLLNKFDPELGDAPAITASASSPAPVLDRFDEEAGDIVITAKTSSATAATVSTRSGTRISLHFWRNWMKRSCASGCWSEARNLQLVITHPRAERRAARAIPLTI